MILLARILKRSPATWSALGAIAVLLVGPVASWPAEVLPPGQSSGETTAAPAVSETQIQFRRIFVPEDRIDDVTAGETRFLPVFRDEFAQLVEYGMSNEPTAVRVEHASYRAELDGTRLVNGSAELQVAYSGDDPAWLELATAGLAAQSVRWTDDRPCHSGTFFTEEDRGKGGVVVSAGGKLTFSWTANGRLAGGEAEFRLTLPRAGATELVIVAPASVQVSATGAPLRGVAPSAGAALEYRFTVRGGTPFVLTARSPAEAPASSAFAVRHATSYAVAPSGVQIDTRLRITPFDSATRRISLRCDLGVEIADVTLGGQPLTFRREDPAGQNGYQTVTVTLRRPLPPGETELRVRGFAATDIGGIMVLPSIKLARSTWLGGTARVQLDDRLHVQELTHDGFQPETSETGGTDGAVPWTFTQTNPQAQLRLRVGRSPKRLRGRILTKAIVDHEEVSATVILDLESEYAVESVLRAKPASGWRIASVESEPAGNVRSWSIESDAGSESMVVVLDSPVAPPNPVRLRVKAERRQKSSQSPLRAEQLVVLLFDQLDSVEQWIEVAQVPSLWMTREGTDPAYAITRDDVPAPLRESVSERRDGYLFAVDARINQTRFRIRPRAEEVIGDVEIHAHVTESAVQYDCRFAIEPQSGEVSQVGIVLSTPLAELPQWRFVDASGRGISAERVLPTSGAEGSAERDGLYRTVRWQLARPQVEPFELVVSFERQREAALPLTLAAIETSRSQSGVVYLSGDRSLPFAFENRALDPLTIDDEVAREVAFPGVPVGAFHFQPERVVLTDSEPPLVVRRVRSTSVAPAVWIRSAKLDAAYLPNGHVINHLSLLLESQIPEPVEIEVPKAEQIVYRVEGKPWRQVSPASANESVLLPPINSPGPAHVEVRFSEARRPLGASATLRSAPLHFSVPVVSFEFRAWLGREYRAVDLDHPARRLTAGLSVLGGDGFDAPFGQTNADCEFAQTMVAWEPNAPSDAAPEPPALFVVDTEALRLRCVALLACGALAGAFLSRFSGKWALVAALAGLVAALIVPVAIAAQVSALAWGCCAAVLLRAAQTILSFAWQRLARGEGARGRQVLATGAAFTLGTFLTHGSVAAQSDSGGSALVPVPRVIDPIEEDFALDQDGTPRIRPAGQFVYVPESLYASLLQRKRELRAPVGEWLVRNCRVRGAVTVAPDGSLGDAIGWSLVFGLETFHRDAEIRLPLLRDGAEWHTDAFRLDGTKVDTWWTNEGGMLHVRVANVGLHDLELRVTPRLRQYAETTELSLPLARVDACSLNLTVPAELPAATFANLVGEVEYVPASSEYKGHLGLGRELSVSWPTQTRTAQEPVPADLFTWMHVGRTSTLIEQRLVVHVDSDRPYSLEVIPPPGVRYLPSANELPYARVRPSRLGMNSSSENGNGRVSISVAAEGPGNLTVPLQYVAEYPTAAATVAVPRFAVEGDVVIKSRMLAVQAAAPDLRVNLIAGGVAEPVDTQAFLSRWGLADAAPDYAYREPAAGDSWRIAIQPDIARVEAMESFTAVARRRGFDVYYVAECRAEHGAALFHRVRKPYGFAVAAVEVVQGERKLAADWAETETGDLQVFLPEPMSGTYTLTVRGTLAADRDGNVSLQLPKLDAARRAAPRLTIARTARTTLEIVASERLKPAAATSLPAGWHEDWYLHGHYTLSDSSGEDAPIRAKVGAASEPQSVRTVMTIVPNQVGWEASLHCAVRELREPLDRIVLLAPREWQEPYQIEPADRWRLSVRQEAKQNRLVLRPRQPTGGQVVVTVRGQLPRERQDSITIPAIRLAEPVSREDFVALGRTMSDQDVRWFPHNLQPLPADAVPDVASIAGGEAGDWYFYRRGEGPQPASARHTFVEQGASLARVSLMEAIAWVGNDQRSYVETRFTLDPRGRRNCEVLVPEGYRLLDVRVNGKRQFAWNTAARRWQVHLDSSQLPQLIQVSSQREKTALGAVDKMRVQSPILGADGTPIPVMQTAWRVRSERAWRHVEDERRRLSVVGGPMLAAVRLANLVETLDEMVPALLGSPAESWLGWLDFWRKRIGGAQAEYDRRAEAALDDADVANGRVELQNAEAAARVDQARQQMATIEEALQLTIAPANFRGGNGDSNDSTSSQGTNERESGPCLLGDGRIETIQLDAIASPPRYAAERILGAILLSVVALATVAPRRDGLQNRLRPLFAALGGLICVLAILAISSGQLWAIVGMLVVVVGWTGWNARRRHGN